MGVQELAVVGLAGSGIGAVLGLPMAWPSGRRSADVRLLGVATILLSAIAGLISARVAGLVPVSGLPEHAGNLLGLTALPLVVIYTRQATGATPLFRGVSLLWAPAIAYFAFLCAGTAIGSDTRVPFSRLLPVVLGFTAACAVQLWRRPAPRSSAMVPPGWIVGFLAVVNVAQIVRMNFGHVELVRAVVPLVMSCGFVAMVAFVAWRSAAARAESPAIAPASVAAMDKAVAPRYEKSGLDEAVAPELLERIDRALAHERLFARADLTLADLARAAGSTPHQVSEALNRYAVVSFHELLNRRRVEDVKAQLVDPSNDRFTIEGIGASAGFGSRSALYAAFRRIEGMTPAAYRAGGAGVRSCVSPSRTGR
jgi:AraC-like DNA-binding protein